MSEFFRRFLDFEEEELTVSLLLAAFFFLVIAIFQIMKPLKNGLFVQVYGADVELYAKLANILVAALGVAAFSYLYNRFERRKLISLLCGFFIGVLLILSFALRDPSGVSIWTFYLLGDLESTLMVTAFWAFSTDITDSDQAKRLFGLMGTGGVIGGWVGITVARGLLSRLGTEGLVVLVAGLFVVLIGLTLVIERLVARSAVFGPKREATEFKASDRSAALDGLKLVLRSPYLAAIVGILAFYEVSSQIMDYQFKLLSEEIAGVAATQAFMANVYFFANLLSVVVQLFVVSFIMRRFGLVVTLLVMPLALLSSSLMFFAIPTLLVSGLLVISDNGLNYSIQQTGRETLYSIRNRDEKYKARAFTNMFIQRFGKGIGIFAVIGLGLAGAGVRHLSLVVVAFVIGMIFLSVYVGRRFNRTSAQIEATGEMTGRLSEA